mmetsp:Transcript_6862/g.14897  ORF Transcript_6862/g.14897 Transcript_6862/m.14897 type:complete len:99 (+) Transcript_6862:99-395(+)
MFKSLHSKRIVLCDKNYKKSVACTLLDMNLVCSPCIGLSEQSGLLCFLCCVSTDDWGSLPDPICLQLLSEGIFLIYGIENGSPYDQAWVTLSESFSLD